MAYKSIIVDDATAEAIRQAAFLAHASGQITERVLRDIQLTLRGVPRNVRCGGRTFHDDPQHVCPE